MFCGTPGILIPKALQFQKESHSRGKSQWTVSELVLTSESREGQEHSHRPGERSPLLRAKRPGSPVWCRQLHPHRGRRLFSQRTGQAGAGPSAAPVLCPVEPSLILQCRADRPRLNRPPLSVRSVFHGFPILLVGLCAPFRQGVCVHLRSAGSPDFSKPPALPLTLRHPSYAASTQVRPFSFSDPTPMGPTPHNALCFRPRLMLYSGSPSPRSPGGDSSLD